MHRVVGGIDLPVGLPARIASEGAAASAMPASASPGDSAWPADSATYTWIATRDGDVAARVDLPAEGGAVGGVVIVPPYALERVVAFRALRVLALEAARAGFVAVSIDLPGDGDSPPPADTPIPHSWPEAAARALAFARSLVPGRPVHAVGLRLGACIVAGLPAVPGERRLLWEPIGGRAASRRLRNLRRVSVATPSVADGVELAAAHLGDADHAALADLSLPTPLGLEHVLRAEADRRTANLLATCSPEFAVVPFGAIQEIVRDLPRAEATAAARPPVRAAATVAPGVRETIRLLGPDGLRAVLTEPEEGPIRAVLAFTAMGSELAVGPGDLWVQEARRWARHGVASIRADRRGLGESLFPDAAGVADPYTTAAAHDTAELIRAARLLGGSPGAAGGTGTPGAAGGTGTPGTPGAASGTGAPVLAVGVCSGAWCVLRAAETDPPDAVLAVNAVHWAPDESFYDAEFYRQWRGTDPSAIVGEPTSRRPRRRSGAEPSRRPEADRHPRRGQEWRHRVTRAKAAVVERWPQLARLTHPEYRGDRVARLMARVPPRVAVHLLAGTSETLTFRIKGGQRFVTGRAPRIALTIDPDLDHSLVAEGSRRAVARQIEGILAGWGVSGGGA